ncbi:MAG TPA: MarR family winged helix-turn-helix transcriptional regulator [Paracoccaceae bacterium]|nr:MarR family winged helix-turn-helix transcriptional regulator [Paracoccaceae bacterium]
MKSTDFDLDAFLPYQLAVLAARISRDFARLYSSQFGLSIPEWRVIAHLGQAGTVSVREIHERVDMDKPKVSRAAERLAAAGLITKGEHPEDGRLVALSLTEKGRALLARIVPLALAYEAEVLARLRPEDVAGFRAGIATLIGKTP